jgi:hypothetical protein
MAAAKHKCPSCHADVDEDFGLVTCVNCGAAFVIGMDEAPVATEPESPLANAQTLEAMHFAKDASFAADIDRVLDGEELTSLGEILAPSGPAMSDSPMAEVAAFGNSEASNLREGLYRYTLFVSGLDSAEIRKEIKDIIDDKKFRWDSDALMRTLKAGELIFKDLSPVKCAILVQRLRPIPVQIRWEQHAIQES